MILVKPSLFPEKTFPYIIVAPAYNSASAGIRALHMLCHSLNLIGQRAFIYIHPQVIWDDRGQYTCPELCTPLLIPEALAHFEQNGQPPVVIYPETVVGNQLRASVIVRWLLNYPGLLGGDTTYDAGDILYAYSRRLAESVGIGEDRVLFLPTSSPHIFYPPLASAPRRGSCFYAAKYQSHHRGKLFPITAGSIEITRNLPTSQTKQQIAELFRCSELFYTYEDTALAIEAGLCGCPTVFIPNAYLTESLGFDDIGRDGFAWGTSEEEIGRAKASVGQVRYNYEALIGRYWSQLQHFVEHTQAMAENKKQSHPAARVVLPTGLKKHLFIVVFIWRYIARNGWERFLVKAKFSIRRRGLFKMITLSVRNLFWA